MRKYGYYNEGGVFKMKKITEEQIDRTLKSTRASFALEGLSVPKEIEDIGKACLSGNITEEQGIEQIKQYFVNKGYINA